MNPVETTCNLEDISIHLKSNSSQVNNKDTEQPHNQSSIMSKNHFSSFQDSNDLNKEFDLLHKESESESPDKNQPFLNKYSVRAKLFNILSRELIKFLKPHNEEGNQFDFFDFLSLSETSSSWKYIGQILYRLGVNFFECEEVAEGELFLFLALWLLADNAQILQSCVVQKVYEIKENLTTEKNIQLIIDENNQLRFSVKWDALEALIPNIQCTFDQVLVDFVDTCNYFGIIWTGRQEYDRALKWFEKCENHFQNTDMLQDSIKQKLSEIETLTTFYLTQVYGNTKQIHKAAKYSFLTLKRQLSSKLEYDPIQWIQNGIQLSGYFITQDDFTMSEHCIKTAENLWKKAREDVLLSRDKEDVDSIDANLKLSRARLNFAIMEYSKNWILNWRQEQDRLHKTNKFTENNIFPEVSYKIKPFTKLTEELSFDDTPKVDNFNVLISYELALPIFKKVRKGLESGLKYYLLDGFVSEHIKICQELSAAYSFLLFYESNSSRRIALFKRRASIIEPILNKLNVNIYIDTLKVLTFELGQLYSLIHEEYDYILRSNPNDINEDIKVILNSDNDSMLKSINYFTQFNNYFNIKNGRYEVDEGNRPAFVRSHFYLASMYYKFHTDDISIIRQFLLLCQKEYKFVVQFIDENNLIKVTKSEYDMSKEMCELLPLKLQRL